MKHIPYSRQSITKEDIEAVVDTLSSEYITQGPKVKEFEEAFAAYIGSRFAVAVANGTAALHLSAMALGVTPGKKVITTPITFAASANCIRYCGGEVVFADIDPHSFLIDANKVRNLLESSPMGIYNGLVLVDFAGKAIDLEIFRELADEYGLWIIEDACHAPGGYFLDRAGRRHYCGDGTWADLAIFSFHPVKHIATGEGGMITTNNVDLYTKLLQLRSHGIVRDENLFLNDVKFATSSQVMDGSYPSWYMEMQELGYNYRLTDFQSALGLSQLKRAAEGLQRRLLIARRYDDAFKTHPVIRSQKNEVAGMSGHAYHLYIIEVPDRLGLYNYLRGHNIYAQVHYIPLHLMPYYRQLGWKEGDMPFAERYYLACLSIPMFPTLTDAEQDFVISTIKDYFPN